MLRKRNGGINMTLAKYRKKRDFSKTKEPKAIRKATRSKKRVFVVQKHYARTLHYDFRIEVNGVLKSFAVPKGLSKRTKDKRLAILTDDHPIAYAKFEGMIPKGEYGGGKVLIWDSGTFVNLKRNERGREVSLRTCFKEGYIEIYLEGERYKGGYALVRLRDKQWLIVKMREDKLKEKYEKLGIKK